MIELKKDENNKIEFIKKEDTKNASYLNEKDFIKNYTTHNPKNRDIPNNSILEIIFAIVFLIWFFYCTYAGVQYVYYDTVITNWFNLAVGIFSASILSIELAIISVLVVLALIIEFFSFIEVKINGKSR